MLIQSAHVSYRVFFLVLNLEVECVVIVDLALDIVLAILILSTSFNVFTYLDSKFLDHKGILPAT